MKKNIILLFVGCIGILKAQNTATNKETVKLSLQEAGLEEEPLVEEIEARSGTVFRNGIHAYLDWFYDGSIDNEDY